MKNQVFFLFWSLLKISIIHFKPEDLFICLQSDRLTLLVAKENN